MRIEIKCRKKPCSICGKWFTPKPTVGKRQKACSKECSIELNRKRSKKWNKENEDYFRTIYLEKKLIKLKEENSEDVKEFKNISVKTKIDPELLLNKFQMQLGIEHIVIMEYLVKLLMKRFKMQLSLKPIENTS